MNRNAAPNIRRSPEPAPETPLLSPSVYIERSRDMLPGHCADGATMWGAEGSVRRMHCACGYDLVGLPTPGVCPECGAAIPVVGDWAAPVGPAPEEMRLGGAMIGAGVGLSWVVVWLLLAEVSTGAGLAGWRVGLGAGVRPELVLLVLGPMLSCWGWTKVLRPMRAGGERRPRGLRLGSSSARVLNAAQLVLLAAFLAALPIAWLDTLPVPLTGIWLTTWLVGFMRDFAAALALGSIARERQEGAWAAGTTGALVLSALSVLGVVAVMFLALLIVILNLLSFGQPRPPELLSVDFDLMAHALWTASTAMLVGRIWVARRD